MLLHVLLLFLHTCMSQSVVFIIMTCGCLYFVCILCVFCVYCACIFSYFSVISHSFINDDSSAVFTLSISTWLHCPLHS